MENMCLKWKKTGRLVSKLTKLKKNNLKYGPRIYD